MKLIFFSNVSRYIRKAVQNAFVAIGLTCPLVAGGGMTGRAMAQQVAHRSAITSSTPVNIVSTSSVQNGQVYDISTGVPVLLSTCSVQNGHVYDISTGTPVLIGTVLPDGSVVDASGNPLPYIVTFESE